MTKKEPTYTAISNTAASPDTVKEQIPSSLLEASKSRRNLHLLAQNLSKSSISHPENLLSILKFDWRKCSELFSTWRELILLLVSFQSSLLSNILNSLVERFIYEDEGDAEYADNSILVLMAVLNQSPSASAVLIRVLEYNFPFHLRGASEHVSYVRSLLSLSDRLPVWRYKILELIIRKAIVIDVELQNESELLLEKVKFEEATITETEGEDLSEDLEKEEKERRLMKLRLRNLRKGLIKLDLILGMLLDNINNYIRISTTHEGLDDKRSREMFLFILSVFERNILPTFKSRYVQFLLFYMSSLRPSLADQFLGVLFKPLVNFCQGLDHGRSANPTPKLLFSVAYIGSFVARAKFLSDELLRLSFEMLVNLSTRLLSRTTIGSPGILPIVSLQNILYIFNNCHKRLFACIGFDQVVDLFDNLLEDDSILSFCNINIVQEFLYLSGEKLGMFDRDCFSFNMNSTLERKRMSKYEDLENFFPFDPICLPRCSKFFTQFMHINEAIIQNDANDDSASSGRPSI